MSRWSQPWRVGAIVALGGLLLIVGSASFARRVGADRPTLGVHWVASSAGPVAMAVDADGPAGRAGLSPGDVLIEVDGRNVTSTVDAGEAGWRSPGSATSAWMVRRGAETVLLEIAPRWGQRSEPYIYLAIVGLAFWASGLFIALRWPGIRGGTVYSLLAACLFAHLTLSHTGAADRFDWSVYWLDLIAGALWPALLLHLGVALTKRTLRGRRATLALAYSVATLLIASAVWISPSAAGGAYRFEDPVGSIESRDRVETLFLALATIFTAALLAKSYSASSSRRHRGQARWVLWGLTVGLGPYVLLYAVPWAVGAPALPDWARFLAVLPMLLVPAAFTAALARYRLHDLNLLLLRAISEVTSVFATGAMFAATVFLLREGLRAWVAPGVWTRYVGFLVAAVMYPQIRSWVRAGVDRAFYRQRYSYRATLLDWARELSAETELAPLLARLRKRVCDTLGVPEAEVLVRTAPRRFEVLDSGSAVALELGEASLDQLERETYLALESGAPGLPWAHYLFSMPVKGRLRAVLAVAERNTDEEPLTTEDRALLGTLAAHAAMAIEAARLFLEVRQRADEIERLHARQERILESSAVGLLLLDSDDRILAWNRAIEGIHGLPRDAAIGRGLREVFPLHVARRIEREGGRSATLGESRIFRLNMINSEDRRRVLNIAISPAGDDGGTVVTFDDVTERVELEEQVLQQERLASLGLLAAGVAHEINTPLTGVSSYAQMLLEEPTSQAEAAGVLRKIEEQTRRASDIANSLLTLARPERTATEELDLNATIRDALRLFQPQVRGRSIELFAELHDGLPPIRGHRGKLQQVLLNLLLNARDAVGESGRVGVSTRPAGSRVVLEITDDGSGIAEEDLPRIFDPFFTTKGRGKGTGLGLSITYGIVQEHDGTIRADSEAGGLTRFTVELPVASPSAQALA